MVLYHQKRVHSYDFLAGSWEPIDSGGITPAYQEGLADMPMMEIVQFDQLPAGEYTFCFGVDLEMNGQLDSDYFNYACVQAIIVATENVPPTVSITSPTQTNFNVDDVIDFVGEGTDEDGYIAFYHWDFGDGSTSDEQNPSHSYASGGDYTLTLTVGDDEGAVGKATSVVIVAEQQIFFESSTFTVTETKTMWGISQNSNFYSFAEAKQYCENLSLADYTDWRLAQENDLFYFGLDMNGTTLFFSKINHLFNVWGIDEFWAEFGHCEFDYDNQTHSLSKYNASNSDRQKCVRCCRTID